MSKKIQKVVKVTEPIEQHPHDQIPDLVAQDVVNDFDAASHFLHHAVGHLENAAMHLCDTGYGAEIDDENVQKIKEVIKFIAARHCDMDWIVASQNEQGE